MKCFFVVLNQIDFENKQPRKALTLIKIVTYKITYNFNNNMYILYTQLLLNFEQHLDGSTFYFVLILI